MRPTSNPVFPILALGAAILVSGCDEAKKFIDPTGKAYGSPPDTTKKSESATNSQSSSQTSPSPAASKPAQPQVWNTYSSGSSAPRAASTFRDVEPLTPQSAMTRARDMLMTSPKGWIEFHNGKALQGGRKLTLWNDSETPWGMGIVDLDQDGADDVVIAVKGTKGEAVDWTLAVLLDRKGSLQCIQSIRLDGIDSLASLEATPGGVLVTPASGPPQLFGWLGGELVGNP